jgi:predicted NACHT family NTPase
MPRMIEDLRGQQQSEGLPIARRFPLRVELKTFSNILVNKPELTLLQFLADEISKRGGADSIRLAQLKEWLAAYPWLLVLDGLDEVPPSGNRPAILRAIEEFRVDASTVNADLLIVATTRPQSYANDFPPELFHHLYLTLLSPQKAQNIAIV